MVYFEPLEIKEAKKVNLVWEDFLLKKKFTDFINNSKRPLCKRNSHGSNDPLVDQGKETICLNEGYLLSHWDSPYNNITGNEKKGNWGHRGFHFSKFYLMNRNGDYTPVQRHCGCFGVHTSYPTGYCQEGSGGCYSKYCKDHGGENIRIWRSEPLIESENIALDLKNVFTNLKLMYNDSRSPWALLFDHLEMEEQKLFSKDYWQIDLKNPFKNIQKLKESFENEKLAHEKGKNNMLKRVSLIFENMKQACTKYTADEYQKCIILNTQFKDALDRRIKEKVDIYTSELQEMLDLFPKN